VYTQFVHVVVVTFSFPKFFFHLDIINLLIPNAFLQIKSPKRGRTVQGIIDRAMTIEEEEEDIEGPNFQDNFIDDVTAKMRKGTVRMMYTKKSATLIAGILKLIAERDFVTADWEYKKARKIMEQDGMKSNFPRFDSLTNSVRFRHYPGVRAGFLTKLGEPVLLEDYEILAKAILSLGGLGDEEQAREVLMSAEDVAGM